ncbi:hypothetical protein TRIUR3_34665 [Triticum urartu]|uniref:Pentatricopeptide repeat-containing protein n=1 Tax=Triticum urartu TaxID=4572 RepID=M8ABJ8_TRIUA|nr:hypothetical protein TRIUR3_34665 [Triticum urartu]
MGQRSTWGLLRGEHNPPGHALRPRRALVLRPCRLGLPMRDGIERNRRGLAAAHFAGEARGPSPVGVSSGLHPASADGLHEASLGQPECLEPEARGNRRALVGGGQEERDMVEANPGDGPEGSQGAAEVPLRENWDPVQDRLGRGRLAIGPVKKVKIDPDHHRKGGGRHLLGELLKEGGVTVDDLAFVPFLPVVVELLWHHAPRALLFFHSLLHLPTRAHAVSPCTIDLALDLSARLRHPRQLTNSILALFPRLRMPFTPRTFPILFERFAASQRRPDIAVRLFLSLHRSQRVVQDLPLFNSLLDALGKSRHASKAASLVRALERRFPPDVVTYNTLADGWCRVKDTSRALDLLRQMAESGITPTKTTYNIILKGFFRAGQIQHAWNFFLQMKKRGAKDERCEWVGKVRAKTGTRKTTKKLEEAASKMMDKFKDIMAKEEAYLKCNELKKRKKGGENYAIMEILKKKMELEERKLAVKQTCEDQNFLYVKAGNLDPDVV